jgi:rod shape-determining protein MreD
MKSGRIIISGCILAVTIFIDTTFLKDLNLAGGRFDLVLVLLVFFSHASGSLKGVLLGFFAGILLDILTLSPFGFYGIIYSVTGYLFGKTKGNVFLDPLFFPLILVFIATTVKILISVILSSIFLPLKISTLFSMVTFVELGINMISAPFVFGIMKLTGLIRNFERTGF